MTKDEYRLFAEGYYTALDDTVAFEANMGGHDAGDVIRESFREIEGILTRDGMEQCMRANGVEPELFPSLLALWKRKET